MEVNTYSIGSVRGFNSVVEHFTECFQPVLLTFKTEFNPEKMQLLLAIKYNSQYFHILLKYDGSLNWEYEIFQYKGNSILNRVENFKLIKNEKFSFDEEWLNISTDILNFIVKQGE